jgi:hypothetical protein
MVEEVCSKMAAKKTQVYSGIKVFVATKQLVSSARQLTYMLVVGGQKYLAKHNVMALEHPSYSLDLTSPNFLLFL